MISRAGYGVMVALLALSIATAYRIQSALSRQSIEDYRQYVQQDEVVFEARQCVWYGSLYAREFFLNPNPDRAAIFRAQVAELRRDSLDHLGLLAIAPSSRTQVRTTLSEFWDTLDRAAVSMTGVTGRAALEFVEKEVAPRRSAASAALRELTHAGQEAVENSELEFATSAMRPGGRFWRCSACS